MNDAALKSDIQDIVVDEVFPHAPETIWKALTTGALISRWLMAPTGFEAVVGNRFTYQTTCGGAWDGVIHCEVLEIIPNKRLSYSWKGGHERQRRIRRATGHGRHLHPVQGCGGHARPPRPHGLRPAEERNRFPDHGRRLEEGDPATSAPSPTSRTDSAHKRTGENTMDTNNAVDMQHHKGFSE